jgi:hypothetical protein
MLLRSVAGRTGAVPVDWRGWAGAGGLGERIRAGARARVCGDPGGLARRRRGTRRLAGGRARCGRADGRAARARADGRGGGARASTGGQRT